MDEIVIIGTGPAAVSALAAYRAAGGSAPVTLVGEESEQPYERPPLSKEFIRGELGRDDFRLELGGPCELRLGTSAASIERGAVTLAGGARLPAAQCLLASGSRAAPLPVPGADDERVLKLRSLAHAEQIAAAATGTVVIVGAGFIGCELAASLRARSGVDVVLITDEALPQERRLGAAAAARIAGWLEEAGVELQCERTVEAIEDAHHVTFAGTGSSSGALVILATGALPRGELARDYGASMHQGAVCVDAAMRADPFLLAAGDVAYARNTAAGRSLRVEHWGEAMRQGEIAGRTLAGMRDRWDAVPGFWSTIGAHTLKYKAWGDGFDESELVKHAGGGWTVWYRRGDACVGVLAHNCDRDYELAEEMIEP
ncbi:MAG: FAD-dependent oxidoreductase [Solirubrobacteraceae bacterium]